MELKKKRDYLTRNYVKSFQSSQSRSKKILFGISAFSYLSMIFRIMRERRRKK